MLYLKLATCTRHHVASKEYKDMKNVSTTFNVIGYENNDLMNMVTHNTPYDSYINTYMVSLKVPYSLPHFLEIL